jgi:hypothetical protein
MLQLHKDLFVRLAISAKTIKAQELDNTIKHGLVNMSRLETLEYTEPEVSDGQAVDKGKPLSMKLDETVEKIIENPDVVALKSELEKVEEIFHRLKAGEDEDLIFRIEKKIEQLKRLIEEKTYI